MSEVKLVEDTQSEDTQSEETQSEDTQSEDTHEEDTQSEDTHEEDTQSEDTHEEEVKLVEEVKHEEEEVKHEEEEVKHEEVKLIEEVKAEVMDRGCIKYTKTSGICCWRFGINLCKVVLDCNIHWCTSAKQCLERIDCDETQ